VRVDASRQHGGDTPAIRIGLLQLCLPQPTREYTELELLVSNLVVTEVGPGGVSQPSSTWHVPETSFKGTSLVLDLRH